MYYFLFTSLSNFFVLDLVRFFSVSFVGGLLVQHCMYLSNQHESTFSIQLLLYAMFVNIGKFIYACFFNSEAI